MIIQKNCEFVKNSSSPIVSKSFFNSTGDVLALQISGANGEYYVEGRNNRTYEWTPLAGINLTSFTPVRGKFSETGIYELGIVSIRELRVRVASTEGEVTIFGQIISTEET